MSKARLTSFVAACVVAAGLASPSQAAPVVLNLTYVDSGVTATASATFDDSLLAPNTDIFIDDGSGPAGLGAFSMTTSGLPGGDTSFDLADLTGWVLSVGSTGGIGDIFDINFFMSDGGNPGGTNGDGLSIGGFSEFSLFVCDGRVAATSECVDNETPLAALFVDTINGVSIRNVPEPMTLGLLGAALAGLGFVRRRKAA